MIQCTSQLQKEEVIATIYVIQMAMNVSAVLQWERHGMTLSRKSLMRYWLWNGCASQNKEQRQFHANMIDLWSFQGKT